MANIFFLDALSIWQAIGATSVAVCIHLDKLND
jgi:hypothetical protein